VTDLAGDVQIDTGENIQEVNKKSVYTVQGTVIQTKPSKTDQAKDKTFSTMVYSNGTGAYFGDDTRVEVKKFQQEPFTPNRSDMNVEPSISQTQAFVARGTVGLCTSQLVAGSSMNYQTPLGQVSIRGQKVVIDSQEDVTTISMLDGESTVSADLGKETLRMGEQALIRRSRTPGAPPQITIQRIPPAEVSGLEEKVSQACKAKQSVYFTVRERQVTTGQPDPSSSNSGTPFDGNTGSISTDSKPGTTGGNNFTTGNNTGTKTGTGGSGGETEIVAVPVIPVNPPMDPISAAVLTTTTKPGG
jgi:hypothetical protein